MSLGLHTQTCGTRLDSLCGITVCTRIVHLTCSMGLGMVGGAWPFASTPNLFRGGYAYLALILHPT